MKNMGLTFPDHSAPGWDQALARADAIVEADHTPPGAFGCLLSRINPRPRLTVVTHFWTVDDNVECALNSVRKHFAESSYPEFGKDIVWSTDLMVLKVKKGENGKPPKIEQFMGHVSAYSFILPQNVYAPLAPAKYPSPTAQLDETNLVQPGPDTYNKDGY